MITYREVKDNGLLNENILKMLPNKCKCGGNIVFSESLHEMQCSSSSCYCKIADRLFKMLNMMEIGADWDLESCEYICKEFNFTTPFQILIAKQLLDNNIDVDIINFAKKVEQIEEIKKKPIELWKIIKYANIRYVSTVAEDVFSCYDSMKTAFDEIDNDKVAIIADKLGVKTNESGIIALNIYEELMKYKDELLFAETQLNIIKHNENPLQVVIAGGLRDFINKTEFINMINNRYDGKVSIVYRSTINDKTDILICDFDTTNHIYKRAKYINEQYISEQMQEGEISLADADKYNTSKDLKKLGEKIGIYKSEDFIKRLDNIYL